MAGYSFYGAPLQGLQQSRPQGGWGGAPGPGQPIGGGGGGVPGVTPGNVPPGFYGTPGGGSPSGGNPPGYGGQFPGMAGTGGVTGGGAAGRLGLGPNPAGPGDPAGYKDPVTGAQVGYPNSGVSPAQTYQSATDLALQKQKAAEAQLLQQGQFTGETGLQQGAFTGQRAAAEQGAQLASQARQQEFQLGEQGFRDRLAALQGMGLFGMMGSGAGGIPPVSYGGPAYDQAIQGLYASFKDRTARELEGQRAAWQNQMAARNMMGSGLESAGIGSIIAGGGNQLGEFNRAQMAGEAGRIGRIADETYQGQIAQRGQDLQRQAAQAAALFGLLRV